MNRDRIEGNWRELVGNVREMWGRLIGDALMASDGKRMRQAAKVQKHYGYAKDRAQRKFERFEKKLRSRANPKLGP